MGDLVRFSRDIRDKESIKQFHKENLRGRYPLELADILYEASEKYMEEWFPLPNVQFFIEGDFTEEQHQNIRNALTEFYAGERVKRLDMLNELLRLKGEQVMCSILHPPIE